jgi:hypothetical protein
MIKLRWLWAFVGLRDYGFKPGRSFGLAIVPRPDMSPPGFLVPAFLRIDGWIDWVDFDLSFSCAPSCLLKEAQS